MLNQKSKILFQYRLGCPKRPIFDSNRNLTGYPRLLFQYFLFSGMKIENMNAYTVVFNNQRSNFQNLISRLKEPFITTNVHSVLTDSIPMLNINSMLKLVILVSGFICVVFVAIHLVSLANSRITGLWIIKLPKQSRLLKQVNAIHSSLIQIENPY